LKSGGDKKKTLFLYIVLASGFHYSAALLSLIFFRDGFLRVRYSTSFYLVFLCFSFTLYYSEITPYLLSRLLVYKYSVYQENMGASTQLKIIILFLFYIFILIESKYLTATFQNNLMLNIFLFSSLLTIALYDFPHVARFGYFFTIIQIILIPTVYLSKNKLITKERLYWQYYTLILLGIYYVIVPAYILRTDLQQDILIKFTPYDNFLFHLW